jgi:hypothetical protein
MVAGLLPGVAIVAFTAGAVGNRKMATADELKTFGSIWHIVKG